MSVPGASGMDMFRFFNEGFNTLAIDANSSVQCISCN